MMTITRVSHWHQDWSHTEILKSERKDNYICILPITFQSGWLGVVTLDGYQKEMIESKLDGTQKYKNIYFKRRFTKYFRPCFVLNSVFFPFPLWRENRAVGGGVQTRCAVCDDSWRRLGSLRARLLAAASNASSGRSRPAVAAAAPRWRDQSPSRQL